MADLFGEFVDPAVEAQKPILPRKGDGGSMSLEVALALLDDCPAQVVHDRDEIDRLAKVWPRDPLRVPLGEIAFRSLITGSDPLSLTMPVPNAFDPRKERTFHREIMASRQRRLPVMREMDVEPVFAMRRAMLAHEFAAKLLDADDVDYFLSWRCQWTGAKVSAVMPVVPKDSSAFAIYLSMPDGVRLDQIQRKVLDLRLPHRTAWYLDGLGSVFKGKRDLKLVWLAQSQVPPFLIRPFCVPSDQINDAFIQLKEVRRAWADCLEAGTFPGWPDLDLLGLPGWAVKRLSETTDAILEGNEE